MIFIKRYEVKTNDGYTLLLFYKTLEEATSRNPNCEIKESDDYRYLEYVDKILNIPHKIKYDYRGREILIFNTGHSVIYVRLYKEDDLYLDGLQYQEYKLGSLIKPITWTISTPEKFYNEILSLNSINIERHSMRLYGQPKLAKPKELKGINRAFSIDFLKNCSCQCFIKDNDIWIKHRDYFSSSLVNEETLGTPLEYRVKYYGINSKKSSGFIYADCWGDIVLRNEAWLVIKNIIPIAKTYNEYELSRILVTEFCKLEHINKYYLDTAWEFFFENIAKELKLTMINNID